MRIKHILGTAIAAFAVALCVQAASAGEAAQAGAGNSAVARGVSTFTLIRSAGAVGGMTGGMSHGMTGGMSHGMTAGSMHGPSGRVYSGPKGNYSFHPHTGPFVKGNRTVFFSRGMGRHHHHRHHRRFVFFAYPYYYDDYGYDEGSCYWRCRQYHGPRFCRYRAYNYCY